MPQKTVEVIAGTETAVLIKVKPATPDLIVLHPEPPHHRMPAEGELVKKTSFWMRAIRQGDVVLVTE